MPADERGCAARFELPRLRPDWRGGFRRGWGAVPLGMGFCLILDVAEPRTAEGLAGSIACGAAGTRWVVPSPADRATAGHPCSSVFICGCNFLLPTQARLGLHNRTAGHGVLSDLGCC